jgi:hypothetical protein
MDKTNDVCASVRRRQGGRRWGADATLPLRVCGGAARGGDRRCVCGERVENARDRTPKMLAGDSVEGTLDLVQVESSLPSTAVRVRARFPGSERARLRYPCVQGERVCVGGLSDWGACCVLCLYRDDLLYSGWCVLVGLRRRRSCRVYKLRVTSITVAVCGDRAKNICASFSVTKLVSVKSSCHISCRCVQTASLSIDR